MFFQLLFLFTVVPIVELSLLIWIGSKTSPGAAIGLVLLTGALGAALARWQGMRTVHRLREQTQQGIVPAEAMMDGFMILVAGLLLITPGILTDGVGLLLLVPSFRKQLRQQLRKWMAQNVQIQVEQFGHVGGAEDLSPDGDKIHDKIHDKIIDAEVIDIREEEREQ